MDVKKEDYLLVLEAGRMERRYWRDVWSYRDLLLILAWRDIAVRYKQTFIGVLWAMIQPLLMMIIFVVVFGKLANLPSEGVPYPIYIFAAMLPWQFFATGFTGATGSMLPNSGLITKVYFPRIIIPASSIGVAVIDFAITLILLAAFMAWYKFVPGWEIFALIPLVIIIILFTFGIGSLVTALNVKYRDIQYAIPFIVRLGIYVSPVGFSSTIIPAKYKFLYYLNPMASVIDGFRWSISGGNTAVYLPGMGISFITVVFFTLSGIWYFRRTEKIFADVI